MAFTTNHLSSKFLFEQLEAVTLIASAQDALEIFLVAELFEYSSSYMPTPTKVSRQATFRNLAKIFFRSSLKCYRLGSTDPVSILQSLFSVGRGREVLEGILPVEPSIPILNWNFSSDNGPTLNLL